MGSLMRDRQLRWWHSSGTALAASALFQYCFLGLASAPAHANTFCCQDASGRSLCSDQLPRECYGKAYREIDGRGITVRRHQPAAPATAEAPGREAEERARKDRARRDQMLLQSYANEAEIDHLRDRRLREMADKLRIAEEQHREALKQQQKLATQPPRPGKTASTDASAASASARDAVRERAKSIEAIKQETERMRLQFDDDKRRYRELAAQPAGGSLAPASSSSRP